uniref:Uncharacterized protein n=1 Tax=Octopus bimaculoides TaxID=37653 RepID=A0A0L8IFL2_OCTBM
METLQTMYLLSFRKLTLMYSNDPFTTFASSELDSIKVCFYKHSILINLIEKEIFIPLLEEFAS